LAFLWMMRMTLVLAPQFSCWRPGYIKRVKNAYSKIQFWPAVLTPVVLAGISGIPVLVSEFRPALTMKHHDTKVCKESLCEKTN
jgi:hypothetical protein